MSIKLCGLILYDLKHSHPILPWDFAAALVLGVGRCIPSS